MGGAIAVIVLPEYGYVKFKVKTDDLIREAEANVVMMVWFVNQFIIVIH